MEKKHNAFREYPTSAPKDSMRRQCTTYSPCVLGEETYNFDRQVKIFWSHLIQRDITSLLFFLPPKLGGLGVGSAVQRLHGVLGRRSFPHYWQQPSHQTQTPSSMQHHDSEPNWHNCKPHFHNK